MPDKENPLPILSNSEPLSAPESDPIEIALKACIACRTTIIAAVKFCPNCGLDQRPQAAILERKRQLQINARDWRQVKQLIWFYVIYLATIIPLFWVPDETLAFAMILVGVIDAFLIIGYWGLTKASLGHAFRPSRTAFFWSLIASVSLIGVLPINYAYHAFIQYIFSLAPDAVDSLTASFELVGYGLPIQLFAIALMPAIWEEIAFRGLIQYRLQRVVNTNEAILLTAALFAIIHAAWLSLPYLFALGCFLGYLRHYSRSLLPGMFLHFFHNAGVVLLL